MASTERLYDFEKGKEQLSDVIEHLSERNKLELKKSSGKDDKNNPAEIYQIKKDNNEIIKVVIPSQINNRGFPDELVIPTVYIYDKEHEDILGSELLKRISSFYFGNLEWITYKNGGEVKKEINTKNKIN